MTTPKIPIANPISPGGIEELAADGALEVSTQIGLSEVALVEIIPQADAFLDATWCRADYERYIFPVMPLTSCFLILLIYQAFTTWRRHPRT
jgi:hypothetical protein